jgi:hypothetical protein
MRSEFEKSRRPCGASQETVTPRFVNPLLGALTWCEEVAVVCRRLMELTALGSLSLKSAGRTLRRAARGLRTAGEFSGGLQFGRVLPA